MHNTPKHTYVYVYILFIYLYYKTRGLYLCSAKAPLLEGSGNRRLCPLKGTSFDRVYVVFGARVDLGFFAIRQKRIRGGSTYAECNSGSLKEHLLLGGPAIVSLPRLDRRDTMGLHSSTRQPHTRCELSCAAAGRQRGGGREGTGWDGRGREGRGGEGRVGEGSVGEGVEGR